MIINIFLRFFFSILIFFVSCNLNSFQSSTQIEYFITPTFFTLEIVRFLSLSFFFFLIPLGDIFIPKSHPYREDYKICIYINIKTK